MEHKDADLGDGSDYGKVLPKDFIAAKRMRLGGDNSPSGIDFAGSGGGKGTGSGSANGQNRFALLGELDFDCTGDINVGCAKGGVTNVDADGVDAARKRVFCPPIFLYNVNVTHLVAQLEAKSPKIVYKIKSVKL